VPKQDTDFLEIVAAGETDRGQRRPANEDVFLVRSDIGLYVVADGAGGHNAGNVASAIATTAVAKFFDASEAEYQSRPEVDSFGLWSGARRLSRAIQESNRAVIEIARTSNKYRGMGTTITGVLLSPADGRLHVAHVGDSRCYRLRGGHLECLTRDHSILSDVLELYPELEDTALANLPRKAVTRALGMEERVRVSLHSAQAFPGDRYLLCSDGVTGELGAAVIEELLGGSGAPAEVVRDIVRAANEMGGRDNITAVVIDCNANGEDARRPPEIRAPAGLTERVARESPEIEVNELTPEIVLLEHSPAEEGSDPRISVVPVQSADASMIRALDRVAVALGPRDGDRCSACSAPIETWAMVCPRCGKPRAEPLPAS